MHKQYFLYFLSLSLLPLQAAQQSLSYGHNDANDYQEEMKMNSDFAPSSPNNQPDKPATEPLHPLEKKSQPVQESIDIAQLLDKTNQKFKLYKVIYKNSFFDEVRATFHLFTRYGTHTLDDVSDAVRRLTQCLRRLQKIEKQTPQLFAYLSTEANPLQEAEDKLQQLTNQLKRAIAKEKREKSHTLDHTLKVLDLLTSLDDYRSHKGSRQNETTFTSLYEAHMDAFYKNVIGSGDAKKDMEIGNYEGVLQSIQKLQKAITQDPSDMVAQNTLNGIQATVEVALHSIIASVRKQVMLSEGAIATKKNKAIEINEKLSRLEKAMRIFCPPAGQTSVLGKEIQKNLLRKKERVDLQLTEWITDFIKETENCIVSCNFLQAEEQLEQIRKIIAILNENIVTLTQVKKAEKSADPEKAITKGIKRLENAIEKELKAQREQYQKINPGDHTFNPYFSNPPKEICEKLQQVTAKNARYLSTYSAIKKDIFGKLRKLMTRNLTDHREAKKDFSLCRSILTSLPKEWELNLLQELTQQEKCVQKEEEIENDHFQQVTDRGDISEMATYLSELKAKKDRTKASQIKETIRRKSEAQLKAFRASLHLPDQQKNILTACTDLQALAVLACRYGKSVPRLVQNHASAEKELASLLMQRATFVKTILKAGKKGFKSPDDMKRVATYVRQLHAYETYRMNNKHSAN